MMEDSTQLDNTVEQEVATPVQEETKTFTQEDLDKVVAERVARERNKYEKKYGSIDLERYQKLVTEQENKELEARKQRGEFEKILGETVEKKDSVIKTLKNEIHGIKIEGALLSAASNRKAVNAEQVTRLLQSNVRLSEDGEVEVTDNSGNARYTDSGKLMTVEEYVAEWLDANPHFVASTPGGSGSRSAAEQRVVQDSIDITKLDMNNRAHRELYRKYKADMSRQQM